jgi:hypothetical protein
LATVNVPLAATVQFTAAYIPLIDIAPFSVAVALKGHTFGLLGVRMKDNPDPTMVPDIDPPSLLAVFAKEVDHIPDTELLSDRTSVNTIVPLPDWLLRIVPDHLPTMSVAVGAVETNPHATTPHATKAAVPTIFNSRRMSAPGRVRRPTSYAETSVCRTVRTGACALRISALQARGVALSPEGSRK